MLRITACDPSRPERIRWIDVDISLSPTKVLLLIRAALAQYKEVQALDPPPRIDQVYIEAANQLDSQGVT